MTKKTKRMFIKSIALTAIIAFGIIFCGCENDDVSIKPPNLEDFKATNPPNQGDDLMGTEVLITSDGDNDADAQNIVNGIPGDTQYQFIEAATNDLDKTVVGNNPQTVDVDKGRDYLPISLMGGGTAKDHVKELKKILDIANNKSQFTRNENVDIVNLVGGCVVGLNNSYETATIDEDVNGVALINADQGIIDIKSKNMKVVVAAHVDTVIGETANVVVADGGSVDEWNSVKGEYKEVIVDRWDTQNTILPDEEVPLGPENQEDQVKVEEPLIEISLISDGKTIETKIVSTYIDGSERNINMVGELGKKTSIQIKVKTSVRMQSSDISLVQKGENAGYVINCHDFEEPSGRKESAAGFTFYNATSGLLNLKLNITWPSKTAEMEGITRKIPDENESVGLSRSGDVWSGTVPAGTESVNLTALGVDEWATVSCGNKSVQGNGINLPKLDYSLKLVNGKGECEFKVTSEDGRNTKICPIVITTAAESEPDPKKELVEEEKKSEVQKVPDMILSSEEEQVESIE